MTRKPVRWHSQGKKECNTREGDGDGDSEGGFDTDHVRLEDPGERARRRHIMQLRRTCQKHQAGIHPWGRRGQRGKQSVDEDCLSCRGTQCTANCPEDWTTCL